MRIQGFTAREVKYILGLLDPLLVEVSYEFRSVRPPVCDAKSQVVRQFFLIFYMKLKSHKVGKMKKSPCGSEGPKKFKNGLWGFWGFDKKSNSFISIFLLECERTNGFLIFSKNQMFEKIWDV